MPERTIPARCNAPTPHQTAARGRRERTEIESLAAEVLDLRCQLDECLAILRRLAEEEQ